MLLNPWYLSFAIVFKIKIFNFPFLTILCECQSYPHYKMKQNVIVVFFGRVCVDWICFSVSAYQSLSRRPGVLGVFRVRCLPLILSGLTVSSCFSGDIKMQLFLLKTFFMWLIFTPFYGLLVVYSFYSWYFLSCSFANFISQILGPIFVFAIHLYPGNYYFVLLIFLSWFLFYSFHFWRGSLFYWYLNNMLQWMW